MKSIILAIDGMTCSACSNGLEKYLNKQNGIYNASVNLVMANATITYDENILIIDTKYYSQSMQTIELYNSKTIHSNNLYQIFTYVKNKDINKNGKVSGMLLYAKTNEDIIPNGEYMMSGNKIMVRTLDLNKDFKFIAQSLNKIASDLINS